MPKIPIYQRQLGPSGKVPEQQVNPSSFTASERASMQEGRVVSQLGGTLGRYTQRRIQMDDQHDINMENIKVSAEMKADREAQVKRKALDERTAALASKYKVKTVDRFIQDSFDELQRSIIAENLSHGEVQGYFENGSSKILEKALDKEDLSEEEKLAIKYAYESRITTEWIKAKDLRDERRISKLIATNRMLAEERMKAGDPVGAAQIIEEGYQEGLYDDAARAKALQGIDMIGATNLIKAAAPSPIKEVMASVKKNFPHLTLNDLENLEKFGKETNAYYKAQREEALENEVLGALVNDNFDKNSLMEKLKEGSRAGYDTELLRTLYVKVRDGDSERTSAYAEKFIRNLRVQVVTGEKTKEQAYKELKGSGILEQATAQDIDTAVRVLKSWEEKDDSPSRQIERDVLTYVSDLEKKGLFGNRVFEWDKQSKTMKDITLDVRQKELADEMAKVEKDAKKWWGGISEEEVEKRKAQVRLSMVQKWRKQDELYNTLVFKVQQWSKQKVADADFIKGKVDAFIAADRNSAAMQQAIEEYYRSLMLTRPEPTEE